MWYQSELHLIEERSTDHSLGKIQLGTEVRNVQCGDREQ